MDKQTATSIVTEINPDSQPLTVDALLESSKGLLADASVYRPFIVSAFTLSSNPPNSNMMEGGNNAIKFFNWKERIEGLFAQQAALDAALDSIPIGWDVPAVKAQLCDTCDRNGGSPYLFSAFAVK
jgi:hypothetical protein